MVWKNKIKSVQENTHVTLKTYIGVHNVQVKVNTCITTHTLAIDFQHKNIYSLSNTVTSYTETSYS